MEKMYAILAELQAVGDNYKTNRPALYKKLTDSLRKLYRKYNSNVDADFKQQIEKLLDENM